MLIDILKQFNWVDVLVIIVGIRICYIAIQSGLPVEFFKLLGTIAAIYIALHYYTIVSDFLSGFIPVARNKAPLEFVDFFSFAILAILAYLSFVLLRSLLHRWIKMEAAPRLNKWGGFIVGVARMYLLLGLLVFMLAISSISYLKESVNKSYLGVRLFQVAPDTYTWLWNNLGSKFMPKEKFNKTVTEVKERL